MSGETVDLAAQVEAFAARRADRLVQADDELSEMVADALQAMYDGDAMWFLPLVEAGGVLWLEAFEESGRQAPDFEVDDFVAALEDHLMQTADVPTTMRAAQVSRVTNWLSVFSLNHAVQASAVLGQVLRWVTMRDEDVRDSHRPLEGQTEPPGGTFNVDGFQLHFPGEPVGPPDVWINCRCMLMQMPEAEMATLTAATTTAEDVETDDDLVDDEAPEWDPEMDIEVPWHGVLAVEGVSTGDRRRFARGALRFDEFPLPLTWQEAEAGGHDGAVVAANITNAWRDADGLVKGEGWIRVSPAGDEVVDLIATGMLRGVSLALDDAVMSLTDRDGNVLASDDDEAYQQIDSGRVRSATILPIAAFAESFIALGPWPDEERPAETITAAGCAPCAAREMDLYYAELVDFAISEKSWNGSASRFEDDEWLRATVVDRGPSHGSAKERYAVPIREPNGDLNRAGVHAAAARINQVDAPPAAIKAGKRKLLAAYRQLNEDPPESLTAGGFMHETFAPGTHDGPGWVTNPRETQRLRTYWTRGKGAAKIRWGAPGDFNRCRRQLAKYVPNPSYLAGTCANLHYVALGVWPGRHRGDKHAADKVALGGLQVVVASSAPEPVLPAAWFEDPKLSAMTPLTLEYDEGIDRWRVYGHAAWWNACHTGLGLSIGDGATCTTPPHSASNYAWYRTGAVLTTSGEVPVGQITMGAFHADDLASAWATRAHYENTGAAVADVAAGEDEHGIWVAGALRTTCSAEQREQLRASRLSGDWRWIGDGLEMLATLAVNVPGFPIPRLQIAAAAGRQVSLVAAGIVPRPDAAGEVARLMPTTKEVAAEVVRQMKAGRDVRLAREQLAAVAAEVRAEKVADARAALAKV